MTVERYICICHPFWFNERSSYNRTCKCVAMAIVFSVLSHFIMFWEIRVVGRPYLTTKGEWIILYQPEAGQLLYDRLYTKVKHTWLFIVFDYLLPLSCIILLNTITYTKLKKMNKQRRTITDSQKDETKLTRMILYVIAEFLVFTCMSGFITMGRIFPNTIGSYLDTDRLSHLLLLWQIQGFFNALNSSVNFITYVSSWPPFRMTFVKMFGCSRKQEKSSSTSPSDPNEKSLNVKITSV
ncbi:hypothetical protein GE061_019458 [Apolygus lucorum]|uniref:G-protein coupled receptors family 1 profile domain-containing protein n=1 Tax=Apolygus lucorum TaxID=248454 RepID=A0A8S9X9P5_APOLU|nr:hypothetical protein GE061_019458 [Apolygus lucorum]